MAGQKPSGARLLVANGQLADVEFRLTFWAGRNSTDTREGANTVLPVSRRVCQTQTYFVGDNGGDVSQPYYNASVTVDLEWCRAWYLNGMYYPDIAITVGSGLYTATGYDPDTPGGSPSPTVITAFEQTLGCIDYNGTSNGGTVVLETVDYWPGNP